MLRRSVAFVLLWIPFSALAIGETGWITISGTDLQIINDGSPRVVINAAVNNSGCDSSNPAILPMDSASNPIASAMYATLLTAKATGQTVFIQTSGCNSAGYPLVFSIHLNT